MKRVSMILLALVLVGASGCILTRGITQEDKAKAEHALEAGAEASARLDTALAVAERGLEEALKAKEAAKAVADEALVEKYAARVEDAIAAVEAIRQQKAVVDSTMQDLREQIAKAEEGTPGWLVLLQILGAAAGGAAAFGGPLAAKLRLVSHALDTTVRGVQAVRSVSQSAKSLVDNAMDIKQDEAAKRVIRDRKDRLGIQPAKPGLE